MTHDRCHLIDLDFVEDAPDLLLLTCHSMSCTGIEPVDVLLEESHEQAWLRGALDHVGLFAEDQDMIRLVFAFNSDREEAQDLMYGHVRCPDGSCGI